MKGGESWTNLDRSRQRTPCVPEGKGIRLDRSVYTAERTTSLRLGDFRLTVGGLAQGEAYSLQNESRGVPTSRQQISSINLRFVCKERNPSRSSESWLEDSARVDRKRRLASPTDVHSNRISATWSSTLMPLTVELGLIFVKALNWVNIASENDKLSVSWSCEPFPATTNQYVWLPQRWKRSSAHSQSIISERRAQGESSLSLSPTVVYKERDDIWSSLQPPKDK